MQSGDHASADGRPAPATARVSGAVGAGPEPEEENWDADTAPETVPDPDTVPVTPAAAGEQRRAALLARVREANKWSADRPT